jgi:hypothetical protein
MIRTIVRASLIATFLAWFTSLALHAAGTPRPATNPIIHADFDFFRISAKITGAN